MPLTQRAVLAGLKRSQNPDFRIRAPDTVSALFLSLVIDLLNPPRIQNQVDCFSKVVGECQGQ